MKKFSLLAFLGCGVVFAQSAGVGNSQFLYPVISSSGVTINASLHQKGLNPYALLVADSAPTAAIACNVPSSTVCNYTTDAAGNLTLTFNPAFGPGVIEIGSGSGTGTSGASANQLAYYASTGAVVAGTSNLNYNGALFSLGQAIASMDPFVTLAEFYDSVSPFPPAASTASSFVVNVGNYPDTSQQRNFSRRNAIVGLIDVPTGGPGGSVSAVSGYARTASTGAIGGYMAALANASNLDIFGFNSLVTDQNVVSGSGTSFPTAFAVSDEADTRITNPNTAAAIGVWSLSNTSQYQATTTYDAFAADILNASGISINGPQPWNIGFACPPGGVGGSCLYAGPTAFNATGTVNTSGTTVTSQTGTNFSLLSGSQTIDIGGVNYTIASITSNTVLTLTASAGVQTGADYYMVAPSSAIQMSALNNGFVTSQIQTTPGGVLQSSTASGGAYTWFTGTQQLMSLAPFGSAALAGLGLNGSNTGELGLANGNTGGAAVTVKNVSATTAYNFNLPATAGTSGYIYTSGGGGSAPNTWTSTTGSGNVVLSQSPALTGTPTATQIQLSNIYTVSTLPACNSTAKGTESAVSDALTPTYLGGLMGGGAVATPVFCNGSAWVSY